MSRASTVRFTAIVAGSIFLASAAIAQTTPAKPATAEPKPAAKAAENPPIERPKTIEIGKPAPKLNITDAHGIPITTKLEDFTGKWVVLDFWGFWCPPCVGMSMPAWMEFATTHKDQKDEFRIITIHDTQHGVRNYKDLVPRLKLLHEQVWKGKKFEFPVIFDTTMQNEMAYKISGFPTAILIDPEGKVVNIEVGVTHACEKMLTEKLEASKKSKSESGKGDKPKTDEPRTGAGTKPDEKGDVKPAKPEPKGKAAGQTPGSPK